MGWSRRYIRAAFHLNGGATVCGERGVVRMALLSSAVEMAQEMVSKAVREGDWAVDATAGNGHDTLFLARLVGENGRVIAFDVQEEALQNTRLRLQRESLLSRVRLVRDGHEAMPHYLERKVAAVMFNLGYLPGGSRDIITRPQTTISGICAALDLLQEGGVVTIVVYTGHPGGEEEKEAVLEWCSRLDQQRFTAVFCRNINRAKKPPFLITVEKHSPSP